MLFNVLLLACSLFDLVFCMLLCFWFGLGTCGLGFACLRWVWCGGDWFVGFVLLSCLVFISTLSLDCGFGLVVYGV